MKKLFLILLLIPLLSFGYRNGNRWHTWVQNLKKEAVSQGIKPQLFDNLFYNLTPNRRILRFDRRQPEKRLTFLRYRNTRGSRNRIGVGKRELRKYKGLLSVVSNHYGVSYCYITAIWGLESSYGNFVGNFDTIRSLATLAFDGRRSAFFRKQLLLALKMLNQGVISRHQFKGEWAGASGQAQFLPSSWFKYAQDFDRDGQKDIWHTHADIFASIANYLRSNGWKTGEPTLVTVTLPRHLDRSLLSLKVTKPVSEWLKMGIKLKRGQPQVNKNMSASVIVPDGGPALMVFNNFKTLMTWNFSSYYAGTVTYVAQKICKLPSF
jgi:membrane-bound lytic murein transglycosylase B